MVVQTFTRFSFKTVYGMVPFNVTMLIGRSALYITTPPCDNSNVILPDFDGRLLETIPKVMLPFMTLLIAGASASD